MSERYSDQYDGTLVCRDCGSIIKFAFIDKHDEFHTAVAARGEDTANDA